MKYIGLGKNMFNEVFLQETIVIVDRNVYIYIRARLTCDNNARIVIEE